MPICQRPVPIATSGGDHEHDQHDHRDADRVDRDQHPAQRAAPAGRLVVAPPGSGGEDRGPRWTSCPWRQEYTRAGSGRRKGSAGTRFGLREPGRCARVRRGGPARPRPRDRRGTGRAAASRPTVGAARCGWAAPRAVRRPRRWGSAGGRRRRGWGPRTRPWAGGAGVGAWVPRLTAPGPPSFALGRKIAHAGLARARPPPSDLEDHLPHRLVRSPRCGGPRPPRPGAARRGRWAAGARRRAAAAPSRRSRRRPRPSPRRCGRAGCWPTIVACSGSRAPMSTSARRPPTMPMSDDAAEPGQRGDVLGPVGRADGVEDDVGAAAARRLAHGVGEEAVAGDDADGPQLARHGQLRLAAAGADRSRARAPGRSARPRSRRRCPRRGSARSRPRPGGPAGPARATRSGRPRGWRPRRPSPCGGAGASAVPPGPPPARRSPRPRAAPSPGRPAPQPLTPGPTSTTSPAASSPRTSLAPGGGG